VEIVRFGTGVRNSQYVGHLSNRRDRYHLLNRMAASLFPDVTEHEAITDVVCLFPRGYP